MNLLLDTHVWLWLALEGQQGNLSARATASIAEAEALYISAATYWEISIKVSLNKLNGNGGRWDWTAFNQGLQLNQVCWLPIQKAHCERASDLPRHHGDPFDRLLIAQAMAEDLTLVTRDKQFKRYDVSVLW